MNLTSKRVRIGAIASDPRRNSNGILCTKLDFWLHPCIAETLALKRAMEASTELSFSNVTFERDPHIVI